MDGLYMVRAMASGTDFGPQLVLCLVAFSLVAWDALQNGRRDYLWVLLAGSVTWTIVEAGAQISGIRAIPARALFGVPLPRLVSVPLQGIGEGSGLALLGLFVGDRFLHREARRRAWLVLLAACLFLALPPILRFLAEPDLVRIVTSRRDIFAFPSVLLMTAFVAVDVAFWRLRPESRPRATAMALALTAIGTAWTLAEVATGGRWIQVAGPVAGTYQPASPLWQTFGFAYDVVVEIVLAYLAFLAAPTLLGAIREA